MNEGGGMMIVICWWNKYNDYLVDIDTEKGLTQADYEQIRVEMAEIINN